MLGCHLDCLFEAPVKAATRLLVAAALVRRPRDVAAPLAGLGEGVVPLHVVLIGRVYRELLVTLSVRVHVAGLEAPLSVAVVPLRAPGAGRRLDALVTRLLRAARVLGEPLRGLTPARLGRGGEGEGEEARRHQEPPRAHPRL